MRWGCLLLAALLLLPGWGAGDADRNITGNETVENGILSESGDIIVEGSLNLINSTLSARNLIILGDLHAFNSTINAFVNVTGGHAELDRCALAGHGIALTNAAALLSSCSVSGAPSDGVRIFGGGELRLADTNISGNFGSGVYMEGAASPELVNTTISSNGGDGLRSFGCSPVIEGCTLASNRGDGVHAEDSLPGFSLSGSRVFGNGGWGLFMLRGAIDHSGDTFWDNALGREARAWSLSVKVHGIDNSPKTDADVVVRDALGALAGPVHAGADGQAVFSSLMESQTDGSGNVTAFNPYSLQVTLKNIVQGQNVTLERNVVLDVMMDLPDLVASDLYVSSPLRKGQTAVISVDVANIGASEADNFLVAFYNGTHLIERKVVARLEPGASVDLSVDWVPQETGSEVLKVKVDSGNSTPEINESNNLVKATVNVQETFGTQFAIPIILLIGVTGYGVFKLYQWLSFRRLTRRK